MTEGPNDHYYSVASLAEYLNLSEQTIRRIIDSERLSACMVRGSLRISPESVQKYLETCRYKPRKARKKR